MNIYIIAAAIDKIRKFSIKDPFLKFFIHTYENLIDWSKIKNETATEDLNNQIQVLINNLYQKIDPKNPKNNYTKKVNPIVEINKTPNLGSDDEHTLQIVKCKETLEDIGFEAAKNLRLKQINDAKEATFMEWWNSLTKEDSPFKNNPAFSFVALKMALDGSKENDKRPTFKINYLALVALYKKIEKGTNLTQPHTVSFSSDVDKKTGTIVASEGTPYANFEVGKGVRISNADKYKNGVYTVESISDGGSGFGSKMVVTPGFKEPTEDDSKSKKTETTNTKVILEDNEKIFNIDSAYINELNKINSAAKEPDPKNPSNGWILLKSKEHDKENFEENLQKLSDFSQPNGWCTGAGYGREYLSAGDFWIYLEGNRPVVAIRFDGNNKAAEIRGVRNEDAYDYYKEVLDFFEKKPQYTVSMTTHGYKGILTGKNTNDYFEHSLHKNPITEEIEGTIFISSFQQYIQLKKENRNLISKDRLNQLIEKASESINSAWQVAMYYNFDLTKIGNHDIIKKITEDKKADASINNYGNSFWWTWPPWLWCMSVSFKPERIPPEVIECIAANDKTALEFAKWSGYDKKSIPKPIIDRIASNTRLSYDYALKSYFYLPGIPEEIVASIAKEENLFADFAVKSNFDLRNVEEKMMPYILRSPELSALAAKNYDYDKTKIPPAIWQNVVSTIEGCLKFAEGIGYDLNRIDEDVLKTIISTPENITSYLQKVGFDKNKVPAIIIDLIAKDAKKSRDYIHSAQYDFNKIPKSFLEKALELESYISEISAIVDYQLNSFDPWGLIIEKLSKRPFLCIGFSESQNYNKDNLPKIIIDSIANSNPDICFSFLKGRKLNFKEVPTEIISTIATDHNLVYLITTEKISEWQRQKVYIRKDFKIKNEIPESFISVIANNPTLAYKVVSSLGFGAAVPMSLKQSIASNPEYSAAFAKGVNYNYALILPQMIESISSDITASTDFAFGVGFDKTKLRPKMIETITEGFINNPAQTSAFRSILLSNNYDLSGYDENLKAKIILGITKDARMCLALVKSIGPIPSRIPKSIMDIVVSDPFLSSSYAEIAKYNFNNIPMSIIDSICRSADYSFAFVKALNFNFNAIPHDVLVKIVRDGVSQNPNLLKILKQKYAEYKEREKAAKEMETKPQKMTPQAIPPEEPIQQEPMQPIKEEVKPAKSNIKITRMSNKNTIPSGFSQWLGVKLSASNRPVNTDNLIEWVEKENISMDQLNSISLEGSIKEANMWKSKQTNKYSSVKITKLAKDEKIASAETLALCVLTLKIYLKDNENIPEEYKNLIENLPSPRQIRQDFSKKECEVLYETVEYLWKNIAKQEIIPEEDIQKAPEKMCGNYWMLNNGVLLKGVNHFDVIKKNSALICALLGIGGMTLQEYMSGKPEKLIWFIIRNGGVRIFISKDGRFYCQMSPEIYGKWGRKKIQKYDFPKKVVKVIDFKAPYENWKSGVSVIL